MKAKSPFDAVVFSGGGSRCFWQVGFWDVAASELNIRPSIVSGTSAGAAMACMIFSGNAWKGIEYFKKITAQNKKNFYVSNIFRTEPAFPHYRMYRDTIIHILDDKAFANLAKGPDIRILFARPPRMLGPRTATFVGLAGYLVEKHTVNPVHPKFAMRMGFTWEVESVQKCRTPEDVADLILHASCTPPVVPILKRGGRAVLDGGIIDNVPVTAIGPDSGKTLLLVTRSYPADQYPRDTDRMYAGPSVPVSIGKWDYTSPDLVQQTYDLGRRDGEAFVREWKGRL